VTAPFDGSAPRDVVRFQLHLLDLWEVLLQGGTWDEAKINAALKTFMASALALVRVQQSVGGQLVAAQKELIGQYRVQLEEWLAAHGEPTGDDAGRPASSTAAPDGPERGR
jgi:hypothetical protein